VHGTIYNAGEDTAYHLRYELSHGAEGETWRADQEGPDGHVLPVAVKILGELWLGTPVDATEMLRKWRGQMHVLRNFNHEGFAAVQVAFPIARYPKDESFTPAKLVDAPAFVMGWVNGTDLHDWTRTVGDPLRRVQVLALAARGLDAFHAQTQHVHRDIKPKNIMVENERSRMVDFGLIRSTAPVVTSSGFPGTPAYRDPAVVHARAYTPASDVYSFAGVIYHQLTTRDPVPHRPPDDTYRELTHAGFERVGAVLAPALSPDPSVRPAVQGAADLLDQVLEVLRPAERPDPARKRARRSDEAATVRLDAEDVEEPWAPIALRIVSILAVVTVLTVVAVLALRAIAN
jgi:serine/threonine protein kinase